MNCTKPIRLQIKKKASAFRDLYPDGLEVPCGKCLACRKRIKKEWSARMLHESSYHKNNSFVTLTYNDDNLPYDLFIEPRITNSFPSLRKTDLQKFLKRLRKNIEVHRGKGKENKIKYFACGEYGDQTQRPHYHLIMFGLGNNYFDQILINESWGLGHVKVGYVTPQSIRYVSQYIDKKFSGDLAVEEYDNKGREHTFKCCSKGLGLQYAIDNIKQLQDNQFISVNGIKQTLPRYYVNKLNIDISKAKAKAKDTECEYVNKFVNKKISYDEFYKTMSVSEVVDLNEHTKSERIQHDKNLYAKVNLHNKKL